MSFTPLVLRTLAPHVWTLDEDFAVELPWRPASEVILAWRALGLVVEGPFGGTRITIERGFPTDLASSPRLLWWFCSPVDVAMPAVVHDKMYVLLDKASARIDPVARAHRRREADHVFWLAMLEQPGGWYPRALLAWCCVRLAGWWFVRPRAAS